MRNAGMTINHRQRYATNEELVWLKGLGRALPQNSLAIILGAGPGVMAAALKDGSPSIHIFMVDIDTCHYAIDHLGEFGPEYQENVYGLEGDSAAIGTRYDGRQCDLLIIDADHSERGVRGDIICWLSHVKPEGLIMIHDYDADGTWFAEQERYPGVKIATEALLARYVRPELHRVGTSAIFVNAMVDNDNIP